jgi:tetratricopeptide (TPR) repeat protein
MFGGGFPGSMNDDVLNAQPVNNEQREKLIEEIKNRAKSCVSSRNYPEAVRLYGKAIELTVDDNAALSILHANRSMVQLNMSKAADALIDADEAVKLDPSYLKGYYRQAMAAAALSDYALAKKALTTGLALKPDDKELQAQLLKVEQKLQSPTESSTSASVPSATKRVTVSHGGASPVPPTPPTAAPAATKPPAQPISRPTSSSVPVSGEEEDESELERLNVRGYKKTADGRTTTFFNHDLDEETKKLIGSIAPKKLEVQGEVITTGTIAGSAWNAAGTYEEKIFTPWVADTLKKSFESIRLDLVDSAIPVIVKAGIPDLVSISIEVIGTENVQGHAQITMNRGKKKQVCDFSATLSWQMILGFTEESTRPPVTVEGQLSVVDITADKEYEIENSVVNKFNEVAATQYTLPGDIQNIFNKVIKSSDGLFQR